MWCLLGICDLTEVCIEKVNEDALVECHEVKNRSFPKKIREVKYFRKVAMEWTVSPQNLYVETQPPVWWYLEMGPLGDN